MSLGRFTSTAVGQTDEWYLGLRTRAHRPMALSSPAVVGAAGATAGGQVGFARSHRELSL
jgi:hypothetical protein